MNEGIVDTSEGSPAAVDGAGAASDAAALARALRDLKVTKARIQQNAERVYDEKRRELVLALLPVLDNLDRTLAAAEAASDTALVDGVSPAGHPSHPASLVEKRLRGSSIGLA